MNDDGDIRYRPDIQGYNRDIRKRVRDTEHQVNLLVTARIRDTSTAAQELVGDTISLRVREVAHVLKLVKNHQAKPRDLRAAWASLAATATICAEAADRPRALGGTAARDGLKPTQPSNVVPIRTARKTPTLPARKRHSTPKADTGQTTLWEESA